MARRKPTTHTRTGVIELSPEQIAHATRGAITERWMFKDVSDATRQRFQEDIAAWQLEPGTRLTEHGPGALNRLVLARNAKIKVALYEVREGQKGNALGEVELEACNGRSFLSQTGGKAMEAGLWVEAAEDQIVGSLAPIAERYYNESTRLAEIPARDVAQLHNNQIGHFSDLLRGSNGEKVTSHPDFQARRIKGVQARSFEGLKAHLQQAGGRVIRLQKGRGLMPWGYPEIADEMQGPSIVLVNAFGWVVKTSDLTAKKGFGTEAGGYIARGAVHTSIDELRAHGVKPVAQLGTTGSSGLERGYDFMYEHLAVKGDNSGNPPAVFIPFGNSQVVGEAIILPIADDNIYWRSVALNRLADKGARTLQHVEAEKTRIGMAEESVKPWWKKIFGN